MFVRDEVQTPGLVRTPWLLTAELKIVLPACSKYSVDRTEKISLLQGCCVLRLFPWVSWQHSHKS